MKSIIRPLGFSVLLGCATAAMGQTAGFKIERVDIRFLGPTTVSEDYIRSNIKLKPGASFLPGMTQDDVQALYATGQFYDIRTKAEPTTDGGVILTYTIQVRPRISDIKIEGNQEMSDSKLKKKITVKTGDPLDEQRLFSCVQEIKKLYEKNGLADTKVKYTLSTDEVNGRSAVTFVIEESQLVKIKDIQFIGAAAFPQKTLRETLETRRRWAFSWLTGSGYFEQDKFETDKDLLTDFYRDHGYLDFEIRGVKFEHPTTNKMNVKFLVFEGRQYKVGSVKFTGEKIFSDEEIKKGLQYVQAFQNSRAKLGTNNLPMDCGDIYTPAGLRKDTEAVQDFYGSRGYIDISEGQAIRVQRIPNVSTGTMDLEFNMAESDKAYVQKIEIRGNIKTKDKVLRRELTIAPGEVMDMVRVKVSKQRLEGLQYFSKVDIRPEPIDPPIPGKKNLVINVEEAETGNFMVGAGFSSVDALVGYAEITQGNFDISNPPFFTGGGEKARVRLQIGTKRQDIEIGFTKPWFLDRKLTLGVDLYHRQLNFESPGDLFEETRTGAKVSLTRALGSDFLIGSVNYGIENVGIQLTPPLTNGFAAPLGIPPSIQAEAGDSLYHHFGGSLSYDTRGYGMLPNRGQLTKLSGEFITGDRSYYKIELTSAWYFRGLFKGHVLEVGGRSGVTDGISGGNVPFYDRFYLGGLYTLRGYKFRNISPREGGFDEPIGGNTFWFGSAEYSIPIIEKESGVSLRIAAFYDIGAVSGPAYKFSSDYSDNWGFGIRLNIPRLGPLRLDYGIPITRDAYNTGGNKFQFGVGYTRQF